MAFKKRLNEHIPFLQLLSRTHMKQKSAVLETATSEQIKILSEIVLNLLNGNIPITNSQKKKLKTFEKQFISLSDKKITASNLKRMWIKYSNTLLNVLLTNTLPHLIE